MGIGCHQPAADPLEMAPPARFTLVALGCIGMLLGWGVDHPHSAAAAVAAPYTTRSWETRAPIPHAAIDGAAAAGLEGKIYFFYDVLAFVYDPSTDSWSSIAATPDGRIAATATTGLDGRIYVIGGVDNMSCNCQTSQVDVYTPQTDSWDTTSVASLPTPRNYAAAVTAPNGDVYVIGGHNNSSNASVATVEKYSPSSNTWHSVAPLPAPREGAGAVYTNGHIYVVGGANGGAEQAAVEAYDPTTNTWSARAPIPTPRHYLGAALGADGRVYAVGGAHSSLLGSTAYSTVEAYDPVANAWYPAPSMSQARHRVAVVGDAAGNIYALSGCTVASCYDAVDVLNEVLPEGVPPSGTLTINGGALATPTPVVTLDSTATDNSGDPIETRISNENATDPDTGVLIFANSYPYGTPVSWDLTDQATGGSSLLGAHHVYAQWEDAAGNWSPVVSAEISYEYPPAAAGTPVLTFSAPATLTSGSAPYVRLRASWTASTSPAVCYYQYERVEDGGLGNVVGADPSASGASGVLLVAPGTITTAAVRALTCAQSVSDWAVGNATTLRSAQETNGSIKYHGTWQTTSGLKWFGGKDRYATTKQASATYTFSGSSMAWVAAVGPTRGSAAVFIDGILSATVNLHSSTLTTRKVVFQRSLTPGQHTVRLQVVGTKGHSRVDIDGFLTLS
jgi:N-acetylneuraminic acid mutarotase